MRLIDADALYRRFAFGADGRRYPEKDCDNFPITVDVATVKQEIRNAPGFDAVPVVRCKDCKKRNTSMCHAGHEQADMDYCSHGEPKENA